MNGKAILGNVRRYHGIASLYQRVRSRSYHRYPIMKKNLRVEVRQRPRD